MADYIKVRLPDGSIGKLPASMSPDEIDEAIASYRSPNIADKVASLKDNVLRYGLKNPIAGTGKMFDKIQNLPLRALSGLHPKFAEAQKIYEQEGALDYDKALGLPKEKNMGDIFTQMAPEIGLSLALGPAQLGVAGQAVSKIPKAGPYLTKILADAIPQMGLSAVLSEPGSAAESAAISGATMAPFSAASELAKSTSPWVRRGAQALGGALGFELGKHTGEAAGLSPMYADTLGLVSGALGARGLTTKKMMQQALTEGIDPKLAAERLAASKRLGLDYLTPAEAGLNPFLAQKQGSLGKTSEGSHLMHKKAESRVASEEKAINELLDTIYSGKEMKPQMESLYEAAKSTKLPQEFIDKFSDNEIIKQAKKDVLSSSAYRQKLKNVSPDSIEYWDLIKQSISDLEQKAPKGERKIFTEARKELVKEIDQFDPRYKEARALSERKITREKLEKAFDKADPSGKSFYKALASQEKFDKLLHNLRNVPEAQARLKDMRMLFKDLINPPSIRGAAALESTSMNKSRSSVQSIAHGLENMLTKGKYDKEMIDFITNPSWDKMMANLNKVSDKQLRMALFGEMVGKALAQTAAHKEPNRSKKSQLEAQQEG